jgi:AMP deaminase
MSSLLICFRISRYTQPATETTGVGEILEQHGVAHPEPPSPASAAKAGSYPDIKVSSLARQEAERAQIQASDHSHTTDNKTNKPMFDGGMSASPQSIPQRESHPQWSQEGFKDTHLSGHEPRYFPGMMARASRRDSVRQGSIHELDDVASTRSALKKGGAKEEQP